MASNFYETIPIFDDFAEAVRPENYRPLPDDWVVGFSDVVGSTEAVANGRYKAVNMVGAGVIAAVVNALDRRPFPVRLRRRRGKLCGFRRPTRRPPPTRSPQWPSSRVRNSSSICSGRRWSRSAKSARPDET